MDYLTLYQYSLGRNLQGNNLRFPGIRTYTKSVKVKFSNDVNEKFHRN